MTAPIEHHLDALALDDHGEIEGRTPVRLSYDRRDPWAVGVHFPQAKDGYTIWTVARCLLSEGLNQVTGDGDFRVTPEAGMVRIEMFNEAAHAALALDMFDVAAFLTASFELVPEGAEHRYVDLDALVHQLLGGVR